MMPIGRHDMSRVHAIHGLACATDDATIIEAIEHLRDHAMHHDIRAPPLGLLGGHDRVAIGIDLPGPYPAREPRAALYLRLYISEPLRWDIFQRSFEVEDWALLKDHGATYNDKGGFRRFLCSRNGRSSYRTDHLCI